jgi:hypothetical protein
LLGYCTGPADIQCCIDFEPDAHDDTAANNNVYYYQNWCGGSLQYLDDALCAKSFPSSYDRDWKCPVPVVVNTSSTVKNLLDAGYIPDQTLSDVSIDTNTLGKIITNGANLCVILSKRVDVGEATPQLYNKYFCAGEYSASEVYETWSSSKIFAIANAGGHLRTNESLCDTQTFGLDSSATGKHGSTLLGDLATIVCSYDHTAGYSSNSLSSYFHDLVSILSTYLTMFGTLLKCKLTDGQK